MSLATLPTFEPAELRRVLGSFATGVTIVTACNAEGLPVGMTANSFNSVSLTPPLVLWSLARQSRLHAVFCTTRHWAVHILAQDQRELAERFASPRADRFNGLDTQRGMGGVPLLAGCAAVLQCATVANHEGGDHTILIGEVLSCERHDHPPLVFHAGHYARLAAGR